MRRSAALPTLSLLAAMALAMGLPVSASVCPGAAACVPSTCPAGALQVGPRINRRVSISVIQNVLNLAAPGAVLCVRPATYVGTLNFNGKAITLISSTPHGAVLQGNGHGPVVTFSTFESPQSVIDGFIITGGSATAGGGIRIDNASPTIKNCQISGNSATAASFPQGGGMYIEGDRSAPLITCTFFMANHADYTGGGLESAYLAHPHLVQDSFLANTASYGAGFAAEASGLVNIDDSLFSGNQASGDGGALHVLTPFGSTLVRRTVIQGNSAGGNGGGLWVAAGFATVLNTVFDHNSASDGGAAAAGFGSAVTIESTVFENNQTSNASGATLENTDPSSGTIVGNSYNLFFNNAGPNYSSSTVGNAGLLTANPLYTGACYDPAAGSPVLGAGMPDLHFANPDGSRNNIGIYGGPTTP